MELSEDHELQVRCVWMRATVRSILISISKPGACMQQVQGYLRFAKLKRAQHVREALAVITEFKNDRLTPGVCTPAMALPHGSSF